MEIYPKNFELVFLTIAGFQNFESKTLINYILIGVITMMNINNTFTLKTEVDNL
ncbi:hypothetical protein bcere0022_21310 [Bacillus cereus Rock3-44]|nr:hypothetical protein bcere0022_21310 [Bacillus cereus Rock3-44]